MVDYVGIKDAIARGAATNEMASRLMDAIDQRDVTISRLQEQIIEACDLAIPHASGTARDRLEGYKRHAQGLRD